MTHDLLIRMTWPGLREFATSHGLLGQMYWRLAGKRYAAWCHYGGRIFEAEFQVGHAHGIEFEATYKPNIVPQVTSAGLPVITVSATPQSATTFVKSWLYTGPPSVTTIIDERVDGIAGPKGIMYLSGGEYLVVGAATKGSSLAFAVVDRDDTLGLFSTYGLTRTRLTTLTNIVGTFEVDEVVTGAGGASGTILAVGANYLEIRFDFTGTWVDAEAITGATSGATATLGTYAEGSVLVLSEYVEDEWVFSDLQRRISPGSVTKIVQGLYLRTMIYNADLNADLEVKVTLSMARE